MRKVPDDPVEFETERVELVVDFLLAEGRGIDLVMHIRVIVVQPLKIIFDVRIVYRVQSLKTVIRCGRHVHRTIAPVPLDFEIGRFIPLCLLFIQSHGHCLHTFALLLFLIVEEPKPF